MKRNGGLIAGALVLLTFFGVSNISKNPENPAATESKTSPAPSKNTTARANQEPYSPCVEIADRLRRFVNNKDSKPGESRQLPASCYKNQPPGTARALEVMPKVGFAIATVPNPVSTHLPLMFDRIVETIQQAAQDDDYSYDASWFPWDDSKKDYPLLGDQQAAEDLQKIQEDQPGVMVFRKAITDGDEPYEQGLVIFLVGEQPTGGISDAQFQNALAWISQLRGLNAPAPLRILGPTFSGSLPSLQRDLNQELISNRLTRENGIQVSSGTVSGGHSYQWFEKWIQTLKTPGKKSFFWTAMEDDLLMVDRFCQYLKDQKYDLNYVAFLSEDETAFGADDKDTCGQAIRLYYPRDIATLRSAYQRQSIFNQSNPQSSGSGPSTTLRGDLSEPANSDHDTVRSYGGQLTPLEQESVLLDIANRLNEKQVEFIILRSTSSLDQIFLSEFLRRSYPGARVVIDGADLLFTRGAEGRSLRGVMLLSPYPLLTSEQDWTSSLLIPRTGSYRTFDEDISEAVYIAARELFGDAHTQVPIHDYTPPAWSVKPLDDTAETQRPPTWLAVIGHREFWPLAVMNGSTQKAGNVLSKLRPSSERGDGPPLKDGETNPLRLPITMWMFLIACLLWSVLHGFFCWKGSIMGSPRARAYFAPLPRWQHPALIALGSLLIAMLMVVVAFSCGLFWWPAGVYPFQDLSTGILLGGSVMLTIALSLLACGENYKLPPLRASTSPKRRSARWHRHAALTAAVCLAAFVAIHAILISGLARENAIPVFWRSLNLSSGVSPLLPQFLLIAGAYLWFWCNLRGLAHFGDDRPLLPSLDDLPSLVDLQDDRHTPLMPMFSREEAGDPIERAARPLTHGYLVRLAVVLVITIGVCALALQGFSVRTLGERAFGRLIFFWVCLWMAVILADGIEMWRGWSELRQLLSYLDRLPLRRTLRALKGLAWGSIWKMSGNVLEERYRVISLQFESRRHLENALAKWSPETPIETIHQAELLKKLEQCRLKGDDFAKWYVALKKDRPIEELKELYDFQQELASTAGMVMRNLLLPEWQKETDSLIFDRSMSEGKGSDGGAGDDGAHNTALPAGTLAPHVRAAEEFFVLPYLAFIQNILGRLRTIALGSLWLFVGTTLAMSSYPFDPLNILGGIFLTVFVLYGGLTVLVYSQMSRDATLSHITNTRPGELGWDFWQRIVAFGVGPLIGLLTTLFPSITDFVFSWLQPGAQALK
jgi:hypothetical protein